MCTRHVMNCVEQPRSERNYAVQCSLYFICTYVKTYTILCGGSISSYVGLSHIFSFFLSILLVVCDNKMRT